LVAALGTAQMLGWGSTFYLPAILADTMAADLGVAPVTVFVAFGLALLVSALVGPLAGRWLDHWGGRNVMMGTSLLFALGLASLGSSQGAVSLFVAWALIGVAMGSGLYDAAFAALVQVFGKQARASIVGITLLGGLASTLGWPLSTWMEAQWGWREACWAWAALHVFVGLPLNAVLPRHQHTPPHRTTSSTTAPHTDSQDPSPSPHRWAGPALALVFAITWFITTAMATHLPRLMELQGLGAAQALAIGMLIGPAQVAGRLLEFGALKHISPWTSAKMASMSHPVGAVLFMGMGAPLATVFTVLHGAGNGILTIAKGTLPLLVFGSHGYGARQGWLMAPSRVAQAVAPVSFGLVIDGWGAQALWFSAALGALSAGLVWWLQRQPQALTPH
jgi:predicted MFS family arabinose efflux permease